MRAAWSLFGGVEGLLEGSWVVLEGSNVPKHGACRVCS